MSERLKTAPDTGTEKAFKLQDPAEKPRTIVIDMIERVIDALRARLAFCATF